MPQSLPSGLITALRNARHVVVLTGAGVSAESGIPTFRDALTGLWSQYKVEELGTPAAFQQNPQLVWDWYAWRRELARQAEPNAGHIALAQLEQHVPRLTLITQNVDGLHQRAGSSAPIELHGSLMRVKCSAEGTVFTSWPEDAQPNPPLCPDCGAHLRPDIVWFGELLDQQLLGQSWKAASSCDLLLSIGTSGMVEPAASFPRIAMQAGATVGLINLDVKSAARPPIYTINARSGELLPKLLAALQ